ncbi:hypothetical protein SAY86_016240 [Trapa natans]|uniref:Uncharacterized protein n=1 Tax=Trapa natans TaxID=22666 RepID=A0AAN7LFQ6_TRANT|nr:hypothetical protein SAY86_016240 [Trapa natans]
MGGNGSHKQAKSKAAASVSKFSVFGFLKHMRQKEQQQHRWCGVDDAPSPMKVWSSDYDRGHYVAEPGIDRKASAFIERFHESHVMESELHAITTNYPCI